MPPVPSLNSEPAVRTRAGDTASRLARQQPSKRWQQPELYPPASVALQEIGVEGPGPSIGWVPSDIDGLRQRLVIIPASHLE